MTDATRPGTNPPPEADSPPETPEERAARRFADRTRTIARLDVVEGRGPVPLLADDGIAAILRSTR
ncbi:MAG: hypothetical protein ABIZ72_11325, partial [Candidatus Limnocylindrales bacterium]